MQADRPYIPTDAVEQILLRLPASSLLRFQIVCKQWHQVIRDPSFIQEHMEHNRNRQACHPPRTLLFQIQRHNNCGFVVDGGRSPARKVWVPNTFGEARDNGNATLVGFCSGLVCLFWSQVVSVGLVNLVTRKVLTLPRPIDGRIISDAAAGEKDFCYGSHDCSFGFHPVTKEHKVVLFPPFPSWAPGFQPRGLDGMQVYTLGDRAWRQIKGPGIWIEGSGQAVSVDGVMYWVSRPQEQCQILSFDLKEEKFTWIPGPSCDIYKTVHHLHMSLTEMAGSLSLVATPRFSLIYDEFVPMEVWVLMRPTGEKGYWNHKYSIRYSLRSNDFIPMNCFLYDGEILVKRQKERELHYYKLTDKEVNVIELGQAVHVEHLDDVSVFTHCFLYSESLFMLH